MAKPIKMSKSCKKNEVWAGLLAWFRMVPAWFLGWFHLVLAMAKPIKMSK